MVWSSLEGSENDSQTFRVYTRYVLEGTGYKGQKVRQVEILHKIRDQTKVLSKKDMNLMTERKSVCLTPNKVKL